jgi:hypothetical protein
MACFDSEVTMREFVLQIFSSKILDRSVSWIVGGTAENKAFREFQFA